MNLVLDIGNTQIFGGVFDDETMILSFRKSSKTEFSSDEFGIFLKSVLRENNVNSSYIKKISVSSVVPEINYAIHASCVKYFKTEPVFLEKGVKTGINIKYKNPAEVGSDRIGNCLGAVKIYGCLNFIIVDIGTATTFDILNDKKEYLGGVIMPGPKLQMKSLFENTAKLPSVEIKHMERIESATTVDAMRSGIYYLNYYGISGIMNKIKEDFFNKKSVITIATGGFSRLYENEKLFDHINYDLILYGLDELIRINDDLESKS
jgi:type III pantothenate kinase